MAFSTELVRLGYTWQLEQFTEQALEGFLAMSPQAAKTLLADCKQRHRDPAWISRTLDELPAPTVAVLALLVEHGGRLGRSELEARAKQLYQLSPDQVRLALSPAMAKLLAVPLDGGYGPMVALVSPAASLLAPLLIDFDVPPLGSAPFVADRSVLGGRAFLAACCALRHVEIKATNELRPHRAALKRFAKQFGLTEDALGSMVQAGIAFGMVREDADRILRPAFDALGAAAIGDHREQPLLAAITEQLRAGPISIQRIKRWLRRVTWRLLPATAEEIAGLPGICAGAVGSERALAAVSVGGAPSGHVTPSFEVFLPPESPLCDIVRVLSCCELVRIDRMIVARVSKASITRATAAGLDAATILSILTEVSRTPVPQNVEVAVRDWIAGAVTATLATGHVVMVDPAHADRLEASLGPLRPRQLAPGVLLFDLAVSPRVLAQALDRAGIQCRGDNKPADATPPPFAGWSPATYALAPALGAEPRTCARIAAWRRREPFEGKLDDFLATHQLVKGNGARVAGPPIVTEQEDGAYVEISEEVEDDLMDWEAGHDCVMTDQEFGQIALALSLVGERERARMLAEARTPAQLHQQIARFVRRGGARGVIDLVAAASGASADDLAASFQQLVWHHDKLLERLQLAARAERTMAIDTGTAAQRVRVTRVIKRGSVWMVLGEDRDHETSVALSLGAIKAVALVAEDSAAPRAPRTPWKPGRADEIPAGHLPCPCGSGQRFRSCCRPALRN